MRREQEQEQEQEMAVEAQIYADFGSVAMPLCFNQRLDEESHQHRQQMQPPNQLLHSRQQLQILGMNTKPTNISMAFSEIVTDVEIDKYINLQNERLKAALREQKRQHLASFIRKLESRVAMVLRQKEQEIAQVSKRAMDLQQYMKKLEMENQTWRKIASENEAMIANLNATIAMTKASISLQQKPNCDAEDAESCCDVEADAGERSSKRRKKMNMVCRRCNIGSSSVLLLPCRHLCCCKDCEAFVNTCPVCNSAKQGCIEVLVS